MGDQIRPLREAILEAAATTIAGMAVKVRVSLCYMECDLEGWMAGNNTLADADGDAINSIIWDIMQASEAG